MIKTLKNLFSRIVGRGPISVALSVIMSVLFVTVLVNAATTISTSITTDGKVTSNYASSTVLSVNNTAYFGGTATTTIDASGDISVAAGEVGASMTRATGATGSFQTIWGDLTYEGAAGGTSFYHAGVMGNFIGADLTNTEAVAHAGVIGKYSVTTGDDIVGTKAGLVGELETDIGDYAVAAILGGDGGEITPRAAFGVQYFNSTAASKFDFGLDLFHAETTGFTGSAVDYGTADIRLQNGETISNSTDGTINFGSAILTTTGQATLTGEVNLGAVSTFTDSDATPDVTGAAYWNTNTTAVTITDFDGAGLSDGDVIVVVSKGAITYDVTSSGIIGGTTDIVTAASDVTTFIYDGTDWRIIARMDTSDDLN